MSVHMQYAPYKLRGGWDGQADALADTSCARSKTHAPGITALVEHRQVIHAARPRADVRPDRRPHPSRRAGARSALHDAPDARLGRLFDADSQACILCGSGTHPGNGLTGGSGANAARAHPESVSARFRTRSLTPTGPGGLTVMKFLTRSAAALLAVVTLSAVRARPPSTCSAAGPAIPSKPDDKTILHVLNRIGFGARPGDVDRVRQIGLAAYIDEQLHPERMPDAAHGGAARRLRDADAEQPRRSPRTTTCRRRWRGARRSSRTRTRTAAQDAAMDPADAGEAAHAGADGDGAQAARSRRSS